MTYHWLHDQIHFPCGRRIIGKIDNHMGVGRNPLQRQKRILHPGDSVFIPADVVHASFNTGSTPAKLMAILGPCVGDGGYVSVEVGDQEPWKGMR